MFKNMKNRISFIGIFIAILFSMIIYNAINGRIGPAIGATILFVIISGLHLFGKALDRNIARHNKENSTTTK